MGYCCCLLYRLCEMGFDRSEAAQAYLACDKNEALAANFLMDSMAHDYANQGADDDGGSGDASKSLSLLIKSDAADIVVIHSSVSLTGGQNDDDDIYG